jgi:glycosyltransferase involved in cell wall biosynthesis
MESVSIIIPSTGRKDRLVACLKGLIATTQGLNVEIICVIDHDQESRAAVNKTLKGHKHRIDYSEEYRGNTTAWNAGLILSGGDYIVFAADDLQWGENWLQESLRVMHDSFDEKGGLVGFNDLHWNGNQLATHYIMSRPFIVDVLGGVIAWDFYRHSFNDLETNERAKRAGRFAWAEKAVVKHDHWTFGDRPQDETDQRWLGHWQAASDIYEQRKAQGYPSNYLPVIGPHKARKRVRVGWLCDPVVSYVGGAEMVANELASQAPNWIDLVPCPPDSVSENVDMYVLQNCTAYDYSVIPTLAKKPVVKMIHDVWPDGDAALRSWVLHNAARLLFVSPVQRDNFKYSFFAESALVPANVNTAPFIRAKGDSQDRKGVVWLGRMWPGKGLQAAVEWAIENKTPVDFYGYGYSQKDIPETPYTHYCTAVDYETIPGLLAAYKTYLFLPDALDCYSRTTVEAYAAGCELVVNGNVGALYWLQNDPVAVHEGAIRFWREVEKV